MTMEVVLCHAIRTPVGRFGGSLKELPAPELGATVVRDLLRRSDLSGDLIDGAFFGQVIQAGAGMNPARQAALHGGVPESVPAATVNRVCGSGAEAIVMAARQVRLGEADCVIAGGMENMDQGPYLLESGRWGYRMGPGEILDATLRDGLNDAFSGKHSGWHTEDLVEQRDISRKAQDKWAARSQQRFSKAQSDGRFVDEIVPVMLKEKSGDRAFDADESNRPDATADSLAKLKPAFRKDGTVTPANSSSISDGAAALVLTTADAAGPNARARIVGHASHAQAPGLFTTAPVPAAQKLLDQIGWSTDEVDLWEVNEAFAVVPMAFMQQMGLSRDIVNVNGGACALGHPIGASGARIMVTLLNALEKRGLKRGVAAICIGGGEGTAIAFERL